MLPINIVSRVFYCLKPRPINNKGIYYDIFIYTKSFIRMYFSFYNNKGYLIITAAAMAMRLFSSIFLQVSGVGSDETAGMSIKQPIYHAALRALISCCTRILYKVIGNAIES